MPQSFLDSELDADSSALGDVACIPLALVAAMMVAGTCLEFSWRGLAEVFVDYPLQLSPATGLQTCSVIGLARYQKDEEALSSQMEAFLNVYPLMQIHLGGVLMLELWENHPWSSTQFSPTTHLFTSLTAHRPREQRRAHRAQRRPSPRRCSVAAHCAHLPCLTSAHIDPTRRTQLRRTSPLRTSLIARSSPALAQHQASSAQHQAPSFTLSRLPCTLLRLLPSRRHRTTSSPTSAHAAVCMLVARHVKAISITHNNNPLFSPFP
ncbi:hypothetical protein U1Q18_020133 [Sarracenia purpurea var. burkii]